MAEPRSPFKIVLSLGCALLVLAGCCCGGLLGSGGLAMRAMGQSDAAQAAVRHLEADPALAEMLGTPVTVGWLVSGSIATGGATTTLDLALPVSGPKGAGTLYVQGTQTAGGAWEYQVFTLVMDGESTPEGLQHYSGDWDD